MKVIQYKTNETIFRQGDPSDCMYRIKSGKVGIYTDHGGDNPAKIAELSANQFLGEMGLLDKAPRSATAVSLSDDTSLEVIDEENFNHFFAEDPEEMLLLMLQMSMYLRRISREYTEACRTVSDVMEADKAGVEKSPELKNRIAKTLAGFEVSRMESSEEGAEA